MAISDEEAVAWAEERQGDERNPLSEVAGSAAPGIVPVTAPATVPARRELTVALTLLAGEGDDARLRACFSVGAQGAPYPVISTLAVADIAEAAAQIPARIAEAEARWLAQPSLPRARDGATVARPASATAKPATGKGTPAVKGKAKGKEASMGGDAGRLAAALLRDTTAGVATALPAPTTPTVATTPDADAPLIDPQVPPPPLPAKLPNPAAKGDQLSLFG